jgi:GMP synthase-like glutamine amidotransferase
METAVNFEELHMKPVVIFRHAEAEGPGFLGTFLSEKNIPWVLVKIDQGESLPIVPFDFSGVVLMGGPMSVNDDLPWIPPLLSFIRETIRLDIPVLGHCLGGQLISKALGATVKPNPIKEIGWGEVSVHDSAEARYWFGDLKKFQVFHWHGETFTLPFAATHLLSSVYCPNQAYAIGKSLAFQCHIEMTTKMVESWCEVGANEMVAAAESPGVQQAMLIRENLESRVHALNAIARPIYACWISGLKP